MNFMDPINLLLGINLFVSMTANFSGAKKGFKSTLTGTKNKPKSYLQKVPLNISAMVMILIIMGIFNLFTLNHENFIEYYNVRIIGLIVFVVCSWTQVWSFKYLGKFYSQEIIVQKEHKLITGGPYKFIRHPQYLSQLLSDLGAGIALGGYIIIPLVILLEIPLFILRAKKEEEIMGEFFGDQYMNYKKQSGFMIPFIG